MNTAVAKKDAAAPQVPALAGDHGALMQIINRAAADPNFDVAKLEHLLKVKKEWDADEARKAFSVAFAAFKGEIIVVLKNRGVTDGPLKGKRYAELFSVVNAVTPALSKHGLSASWRLSKDEKDWIEVTCTVKHVLGHSESVSMGGPADTGGAKSPIQARASTITYLERYTLKAICGVAEQGDDNDGANAKDKMLEADYQAFVKQIEACTTKEKAKEAWRAALAACEKLGDVDSANAIKEVLKKHLAFIEKASKG